MPFRAGPLATGVRTEWHVRNETVGNLKALRGVQVEGVCSKGESAVPTNALAKDGEGWSCKRCRIA